MKNFALISLLALLVFAGSCTKNIGTPLSFSVDTLTNVYINNNDSQTVAEQVKFLAGNTSELVKVTMTGLPHGVTLAMDTISGTGNFTANFVLYASGAVVGYYPVQIVTYSPSNGYRSYTFNLGVVNNDCASFLSGNFTGTNACKATGYTYTATATAIGNSTLSLTNVGGYGSNTNATLVLNCNTDSVYMSRQSIGNGITMWGTGHFSANQVILSYIALNVPGGYNDTCTMTLTN